MQLVVKALDNIRMTAYELMTEKFLDDEDLIKIVSFNSNNEVVEGEVHKIIASLIR
jgi:hypothetical protein